MALILVTLLAVNVAIVSVLLVKSGSRNPQKNQETVDVSRTVKSDVEQKAREEDQSFAIYNPPKINPKGEYTILMLGDSMTHALGPHGGSFNKYINQLYSPKGVLVDNYGYSANIFSIDERLNQSTTTWDVTFDAISIRPFDVIIIESFAYNPLSEFGLEEGLRIQSEFLDVTVRNLTLNFGNSQIIFLATISPNKTRYGRKSTGIPTGQSKTQAEERIAYIKNHIEFAKTHKIPLINVYEKSLTPEGDGDLKYINPDDDIHPSREGIELISKEMANFISANQIFPK